jgi:hypothetical protein
MSETLPDPILCNVCGDNLVINYDNLGPGVGPGGEIRGLAHAKVTGGYFSDHLLDLNMYDFSICEKCLREMFLKFKIKPDIYDVSVFGEIRGTIPFESDQYCYEDNMWRKSGKDHDAYMNGICNRNKDCQNKAIYSMFNYNEFTEDCCCEDHKPTNNSCYTLKRFIPHKLKILL